MTLKDPTNELNLSFSFKVESFNYIVFATSELMKCFGGWAEGHLIRLCLEKSGARQAPGHPCIHGRGTVPGSTV